MTSPVSLRARLALVSVLSALLVPVLSSCTWTEGICMDDEVWVDFAAGGSDCRERQPTDPDCPDSEIPHDQGAGREVTCVPNDISRAPYSTSG